MLSELIPLLLLNPCPTFCGHFKSRSRPFVYVTKRIDDYPRLFSIFAPQVSQKRAGSFTVAPHAVHSTVVGSVQSVKGLASAGTADEPAFDPSGMNFTIRKEIRPPIAPPTSAAVTTPRVDLTPRRRIAITTNDISLKNHRNTVKSRKSFSLPIESRLNVPDSIRNCSRSWRRRCHRSAREELPLNRMLCSRTSRVRPQLRERVWRRE